MASEETGHPAIPWEQVAAGAFDLASETHLAEMGARFLTLVRSWGAPSAVLCAFRDPATSEGFRMVPELTSGTVTAGAERALATLFAENPPGTLTRPTVIRPTEETPGFKVRDTLVVPWAHGAVSGFLVLRGLARPEPPNMAQAVALLAQSLWPRAAAAAALPAAEEPAVHDAESLLRELRAIVDRLASAKAEKPAPEPAPPDPALGAAFEEERIARRAAEAHRDRLLGDINTLRAQVEAAERATSAGSPADEERQATRAGRDAAVEERDAARSERDAAAAERDAARSERDTAVAERDTAVAERDAARSERDAARSARDTAVAERDAARPERDAAAAERDAAIAQAQEAKARVEPLEAELAVERFRTQEARAASEALEKAKEGLALERDEARAAADAARAAAEEVRGSVEEARVTAAGAAERIAKAEAEARTAKERWEASIGAFREASEALRRTPFVPPTVRVSFGEAESLLEIARPEGERVGRILLLDRDAPVIGPFAAELERAGLDVLVAHHADEVTLFLKTPDARGLTALVLDVMALRSDQSITDFVRNWRHDLPGLPLFLTFRSDSTAETDRAQRLPSTATAGFFPRPLQAPAVVEAITTLARRAAAKR